MSKKGHHGGAWKVAYADFVTAMMALFLTLWLTAQDTRIKIAIERAFRNPFASVTKENVGIIPNKENQAVRATSGNFDSASAVELTMLRRLNEDLLKSLKQENEDPANKTVELELTPDGLRINIFDRSHKPIFEPQSAQFTPYGDWVFSTLAWDISRYRSFTIELEGHTESGHAPLREDFGDWEISSERANAARRKLLQHGVSPGQVRKVAGFADTRPMPNHQAEDEVNRRVTVMLKIREPSK
jgi:chemotaxis protein MotB